MRRYASSSEIRELFPALKNEYQSYTSATLIRGVKEGYISRKLEWRNFTTHKGGKYKNRVWVYNVAESIKFLKGIKFRNIKDKIV